MGETAKLMNRYIAGIEPGQLFTTRHCLPFGSRAAIDQKLYRLVRAGVLVRLARGVFVRYRSNQAMPSPEEVASVKAHSFGRLIASHGSTHQRGPQIQPDNKAMFATDASSSTFKYGDLTIHFKKTCWRKMSLQKSKTGNVLVGLWHVGKQQYTDEQIAKAVEGFGPVDKMRLRESATWIPSWLSAYFLNLKFNAIRRQLVFV